MNSLSVTFIQTDLYWQDIEANLAMLEEKIWQIEGKTDLIILPEMFNTGFSMNAKKLAEPLNFQTFRWMNQMAKQSNAAICGSYIVKESGQYYNRLHFVEPEGGFDFYDKRHLFRMGDEHMTFNAGSKRMIRNFRGARILPLVCYDLRFPVWSKNRYNSEQDVLEYDIMLYVANWPAPRTQVWDTLLRARALENQCFSLGVNRTGKDGEGIEYIGQSIAYDFKGQALNTPSSKQEIITISLDLEALHTFRKKFPVYRDWDNFEIKL